MSKNDSKSEGDDKKLVIIVVPYLTQSHLNMFYHFCRNIISSCGTIRVHYVSSTQHINQLKLRDNTTAMRPSHDNDNNDDVIFHDYYVPSCDHLIDIFRAIPHLHDPVYDLVKELSKEYGRVVVIHDALMASVVERAVGISNVESYTFNTVSIFFIFVNTLRAIPEKHFELDPPDALPTDLPSVSHDLIPAELSAFITQQQMLNLAIDAGMLYNGSRAVEGTYVRSLEKLYPHHKHFAVGPVISNEFVWNHITAAESDQSASKLSDDKVRPNGAHRCLKWLDQQENDSVIYVSFGTTTTLPEKQILETATGLEKSGHKFIWVLRDSDKSNIFTDTDNSGADEVQKRLPEGFSERVGDRGLVITGEWVPQLEILGHPAVGGFMTHCGWGSLTESMTMGVPIIACPIHSDQPLNSILVTKVLKVGILIKEDYWETRGQLIVSDVLESAVKRLMASDEGEEVRRRAKEISQALRDSMVAKDGATRSDLDAFIAHINRPNDQPVTN